MTLTNPDPLTPIFTYLRQLAASNYFGSLSIRFERGRVVHLYREESIKPEALQLQLSPKDDPTRSPDESNSHQQSRR